MGSGAVGQRLHERIIAYPRDEVATTIISFEEQTRGWLAFRARARTLPKQVEAYRKLKRHLDIYLKIPVLEFDNEAAAEFERTQHLRLKIGTMDLKIAAIALAHDATMLTRNLKDSAACRVCAWKIGRLELRKSFRGTMQKLRVCLIAMTVGGFISVTNTLFAQQPNLATTEPISKLLALPAPLPESVYDRAEPKERTKNEIPPPDDAPLEQVLKYWQQQSRTVAVRRPQPSEKARPSSVGGCRRRAGNLTALFDLKPVARQAGCA
jgi:tRNA(fMet)-specific endonuclease VapC